MERYFVKVTELCYTRNRYFYEVASGVEFDREDTGYRRPRDSGTFSGSREEIASYLRATYGENIKFE